MIICGSGQHIQIEYVTKKLILSRNFDHADSFIVHGFVWRIEGR
jgi:hypothetical protein